MIIVKYDGTFEGLLTLVYQCIKSNLLPDDVASSETEENLFSETIF